jgi:hypothetical protein
MLSTKFQFIWESCFRGEDFLEINQSEIRMACGGHVCKWIGIKCTIFIEDLPRILPTKFRFSLAKRFQRRRFFRNQPIKKKNGL